MLDIDWNEIRAEYIRTNISYRKLAEKHKVSPTSLYRRMTAEKWTEMRKQKNARTVAKFAERIATKDAAREVKRADMFDSVADKLLAMICAGIDDGTIIATSGKGFKDITGALKDLKDIKGLKNELDVQEQIARIEKLKKDTQTPVTNDGETYGVIVMPSIMEGDPNGNNENKADTDQQ